VDNTIVKEVATGQPKIPGSSLAGVARAYTAMKTGKYPRCAGRGGERGRDHCRDKECQVCVTYGFSSERESFQGLAQFSDARVLFFPVSSIAGPLWITSPAALEDAGMLRTGDAQGWNERLDRDSKHTALVLGSVKANPVNLGWICLEPYAGTETRPEVKAPAQLKLMLDRLVMISEKLFGVIAEDQLEVRTSVSISPVTGAAESGALFTSEAIPRATVLYFQVAALNPRWFKVPGPKGGEINHDTEWVHSNVWTGLELVECLGVGGVNTRGMGRMRVLRPQEGA
jgi:CRISPR-associated protein Cmr4